jgi:hypothetical protein
MYECVFGVLVSFLACFLTSFERVFYPVARITNEVKRISASNLHRLPQVKTLLII